MSIAVSDEIRPSVKTPKSRAMSFISRLKEARQRKDAETLHDVIARATKLPARMWGTNVVGFGRYRYKTPSGRKSEFAMAGFSPKKPNKIAVYLDPAYEKDEEALEAVGKVERGPSCIYIRDMKRIDLKALETLVARAVARIKKRYSTSAE